MIENKLKLGLLSTAIEAQRLSLRDFPEETAKKIFILPTTINYHFVLEAPALINQHLKAAGKERFLVENDEFSTSYKMIKFIFKFLTADSDMTVSFGPVMDVFGNQVDSEGNSFGHTGQKINVKDYFLLEGNFTEDDQRDAEYTRMLGDQIIEKLHTHSTALSSHVIAFTAFELISNKFKNLDLFGLLRLPAEDTKLDHIEFSLAVERTTERLKKMCDNSHILLSPEINFQTDKLIEHGLANMGVFHAKSALFKESENSLNTEDMKLLFYYHNRLSGFDLERYV